MQYRLWRMLSWVLGRLPLRLGYGIASGLGWLGFYAWPRGRRATTRNYARVLAGESAAVVRRTARRSLQLYCQYLVDFARFPSRSGEEMLAACIDEDGSFGRLSQLLAGGRGAVIACMHFGNWDLGAAATTARGFPLSVVVEPFTDPRLDRLVGGSRERLGMKLVPMDRVGPSLIRGLRRGELVALLIDRPVPGEGVVVPFFGGAIEVPAGPARLALTAGVPVIAAAFPRTWPGRPEVTVVADFDISAERTGDTEADVARVTAALMAAHERFIRRYPDQWYMFREMWPRDPKGGRA